MAELQSYKTTKLQNYKTTKHKNTKAQKHKKRSERRWIGFFSLNNHSPTRHTTEPAQSDPAKESKTVRLS
jgi:hypothetical protein